MEVPSIIKAYLYYSKTPEDTRHELFGCRVCRASPDFGHIVTQDLKDKEHLQV